MVILFCEPTIALKLSHDFGYTESKIQLYILSYALAATLGSLLTLVIRNRIERRLQIVICNVMLIGGQTMVGPSRVLGLPNLPSLPAIGLALAGFAKSKMMIESLPDAAEGGRLRHPLHSQEVSDIINTTSICLMGANTLISPLISSVLSKYCGFDTMMDWLLLVLLVSGVAYIFSTVYDWL